MRIVCFKKTTRVLPHVLRACITVVVTESGGLSGSTRRAEIRGKHTLKEKPINKDWTGSLVPVRGTCKSDVSVYEHCRCFLCCYILALLQQLLKTSTGHWSDIATNSVTAIFFLQVQ